MNRKKKQCGFPQWAVLGIVGAMAIFLGLIPTEAQSRVPPLSSENHLADEVRSVTSDHQRSWAAFRSDDAKNVCVTVVNYGPSEIFVHLFRKRSLTGAFTVLPQRASAMCSDVTVIELECASGSCQPEWYISETYE